MMKQKTLKQQVGGTLAGFIAGLALGLGGALVVAMYITKAPTPLASRGQSRSLEQNEAEAKRNRDWNPNAPLVGAGAAKAPTAQDAASTDAKSQPDPTRPDAKNASASSAQSADPLGDLVKSKTAAPRAEPGMYYVQVGAFRSLEDAEAQRGQLTLNGIESKVFERDQAGRVMYRVRVGPFETRAEGEQAKERLDQAGLQTTLVRVQ